MKAVWLSEGQGYRHYFYGGSANALLTKKLLENFPRLQIVGSFLHPCARSEKKRIKIFWIRLITLVPIFFG